MLTEQEVVLVVLGESGVGDVDSGSCLLRVVVEGWDWRVVNGGWEKM